ncbi:16S rRNA (guanine(527)-N(7))-methyltransferase RsmG [Campylobacter sp. RM9344]|uniref:Ribosomal RNA small subunit methyltransferase G n=1 Tax=Campylobacter californiensis TaxID=1032243 RepID=A0AAW3ZTG0_9BACT|nr:MULTISPECIES: 16S rRNA (guanine(527)-N(7))-methyltransferase RsmG [unclassified Campylobacter]MBE2984914.1 16S rRNA (guanine(527)-N(7))-methyltransferase RsmG [Campylobacter sp. RM6883]MBE2986347.1 16S rRNA (guanine(527)-N(7))-methyltransferase RsmG [Campylobacter sp. RM12919]MBE2988022.1 16S rRNA (guanine(527)-N(7))-methyltransferase RsmG [Campylobacter sp. RM12920]MBE2995310.1 16S rRNA (guanine(527)-N(7))-methyltransferase RsmG [Campylobacter sp. RM6913]MBE3029355.1 16S rRNA (guanine(527)
MKNSLVLSPEFKDKTVKFAEILAKFNRIHSLTNYKNIDEQILDSIAPIEIFDIKDAKVAIDVGSGAGFPAIFLAMIMNECEWHLFEPNAKKSSFLSYAKVALNLQNLTVHSQKIENSNKFHADLITSRALMKTPQLIKICNGFYDKSTKFLLYKGSSVNEELGDIKAEIYNNKNRNYILMENIC